MRPALLLLAGLLGCSRPAGPPPLRVAAAADLQRAFAEIAEAFTEKSGRKVTLTLGSSGLLSHQIKEGAPFDLFAAAGAEYVDRLAAADRIVPETRAPYARGRLALWTRADGPALWALADLGGAAVRRVALANPEHAPYGRAARQALERAGLWEALRGRVILGENVRQALQFAETGNADAALVALSLARGAAGRFVEVPAALHDPLDQVLAVVRGGDEAAAAALGRFVRGPAGQAILGRHGFLPPPSAGGGP